MKLRRSFILSAMLCLLLVSLVLPAAAAQTLKITRQPQGDSAAGGETVSTTIRASGDGVRYRWYYKDPGEKTYTRTNDTDNTFSFTMTTAKSGRKAYCKVTDKHGNVVKSSAATFHILKITKQPADSFGDSGDTLKTSVSAKGKDLTYRWYYKDPGDKSFHRSSVTGKTYSFKMAKAKSGRQVYCRITDAYGNSVKSQTATFVRFAITKQPENVQMEKYDEDVKFSITAVGDGLTYQWYIKDPKEYYYHPVNYSWGRTNTYKFELLWSNQGRHAYCEVKDKYGNCLRSDTVVGSYLKLYAQPKSAYAPSGKTVSTDVLCFGQKLTYRWYYKDPGDKHYKKSKWDTKEISFTMTSAKSGRRAYCVIEDEYGNFIKTDSMVFSRLEITKQPADKTTKTKGATVKTTVKALGDGLRYRWYIQQPGDDAKTSCTKATYSCKLKASKTVYCIITDKHGNSIKSDAARLKLESSSNSSGSGSSSSSGSCTWCDGNGNCDACGGDGYVREWLPGTREYVTVRCDDVFCSGGSCTRCGGDGKP